MNGIAMPDAESVFYYSQSEQKGFAVPFVWQFHGMDH
jgi:hypothetical protein